VEADDDDASTFDEADPQISAIPICRRKYPDSAPLRRGGIFDLEKVIGLRVNQLGSLILDRPLEVAQALHRVGPDLDPPGAHRASEAP
jgi:hypothetical protein